MFIVIWFQYPASSNILALTMHLSINVLPTLISLRLITSTNLDDGSVYDLLPPTKQSRWHLTASDISDSHLIIQNYNRQRHHKQYGVLLPKSFRSRHAPLHRSPLRHIHHIHHLIFKNPSHINPHDDQNYFQLKTNSFIIASFLDEPPRRSQAKMESTALSQGRAQW